MADSKTFLAILLLGCIAFHASAQISVSTASALWAAVNSAGPGTEIIVEDGASFASCSLYPPPDFQVLIQPDKPAVHGSVKLLSLVLSEIL